MDTQQPVSLPPDVSPLREWRLLRRLTLGQAAERFQTTEATLSRIETGSNPPSRDLEDRIVGETRLTRDQLLAPWLRRRRKSGAVDGGPEASA